MAHLLVITLVYSILSITCSKEISIPLLYDYPSEMIFFVVRFGTFTTSFFYPISVSSKYCVLYTFGKNDFNSSTLNISQNYIQEISNNLTGYLSTDALHLGEYSFNEFEFVFNTDNNPIMWRTFRGLLTLSRSQYAFHNQLFKRELISQRIIQYDENSMLRIGGYNSSHTLGTCNTIINGEYWSCAMKGFVVGEIGQHSNYIDVKNYRGYLRVDGIATLHSMEVDITAPFEYLEWFKVNYFGIQPDGIMNDGCNEAEDEDTQHNVIFKIACYNKLPNTYHSLTFFIGKDLAITIPANDIFCLFELTDKTIHVFKIQFKEGLKEWNFGWRILKNNYAVLNEENNTIGLTLSQNVFITEAKFPISTYLIISIIAYILISLKVFGIFLLLFIIYRLYGKDLSSLLNSTA